MSIKIEDVLLTLLVKDPVMAFCAIRIFQPLIYLTATCFCSSENIAYRNQRI